MGPCHAGFVFWKVLLASIVLSTDLSKLLNSLVWSTPSETSLACYVLWPAVAAGWMEGASVNLWPTEAQGMEVLSTHVVPPVAYEVGEVLHV